MTGTSDAACLTCPTVLLRACTVIALNAVREKGSLVRHIRYLTGTNNVVCYLQEDVQRLDLGLRNLNRDLRPVMDGQTLALTAPALSTQGRFGYV